MLLLRLLKNKPVNELTSGDLKRYLVYAMEKQGISEHTAHNRLNALKFYFEQVLWRENFFWEIPRPKKPSPLPKVLREEELGKMFNVLKNKKHKAMLFTIYSARLQVSELVNIKIGDVDNGRMQIFIQIAKGKTAYPVRTVQQLFSNAKNKAGIRKEAGIHSLRHGFATHLLEKGTDIIFIKDLLGHFDIKTTERYLHVNKQKLINIISPLDDLLKRNDIEWQSGLS